MGGEWVDLPGMCSVFSNVSHPALCKKSSHCSYWTDTQTKALATEGQSHHFMAWGRRDDQVSRLELKD